MITSNMKVIAIKTEIYDLMNILTQLKFILET